MVFQFYGKVGTEKTKSQGGIFMHMADALVTPAVAGTAELEADGDAYETAAAVYKKFGRSGKHSGPYTCEAGLTGTQMCLPNLSPCRVKRKSTQHEEKNSD